MQYFKLDSAGRMFDAIRFRWTTKVIESDFKYFSEGKHVLNHICNSDALTDKSKL